MVFVTVALVSLYTLILPFLSVYVLKLFDAPQYYQLRSYYDKFTAGYLPQGTILDSQTSIGTNASEVSKNLILSIWRFIFGAYQKSAVYNFYQSVITNDHVIDLAKKIKSQSTPFYVDHILPVINSFESFQLKCLVLLRPYYLEVIEFVVPRFLIVKDSYLGYYEDLIEFLEPYYRIVVDGYVSPFYSKYLYPTIQDLIDFHFKYVHPYYLENEELFSKISQGFINFIVGVLIFKLFEKRINSFLELVLTDIYDVNQGLKKNYTSEFPDGLENTSLIESITEDEAQVLLKSVKQIDSMRPLDTIVDHETDFSGILNSSTTSFDDDSPTKVDIPARHPYSQKAEKKNLKGKKGQQIKKDLDNSFLDNSLASGVLGQNGHHAHVSAQVQVQVIDESGAIEIQEEIEDELAGKGKPDGKTVDDEENREEVNDDDDDEEDEEEAEGEEDEEEEEEEEEEYSGDSQNTEEIIKQRLNSVSDSSDIEEPGLSQLPKILTDFSTPKKYNTGLFYNSSSNGLITAAIPLTPSPTKPAFGVLFEERMERSSSPHTSIMSSSSVASRRNNDLSLLSISSAASFMKSLCPSKPSTACVSEETIYVTNGEAEPVELKNKNSIKLFTELNSKSGFHLKEP